MLRAFAGSLLIAVIGLTVAYIYDGMLGVGISFILAILEISLSFENAIVNAGILKDMAKIWRHRFLTWGIFIAVFGMRFIFPIVLVSFVTGLGSIEVLKLALQEPAQYAEYLLAAHGSIAAFGGMFLLMVFLGFILNPERNIHWLGVLEQKVGLLGHLESIEVVSAMLILVALQRIIPAPMQTSILISGIAGVATFVIINSMAEFMNNYYNNMAVVKNVQKAGIMSFVYLEVLDASFSFDGVIGAFAITKDIVIMMIGLTIGAFFVRSMTIMLVDKKTLDNYIYLEHGAHYALGILAVMMLISIVHHIPEVLIGGTSLAIISLAFISSVRAKRRS